MRDERRFMLSAHGDGGVLALQLDPNCRWPFIIPLSRSALRNCGSTVRSGVAGEFALTARVSTLPRLPDCDFDARRYVGADEWSSSKCDLTVELLRGSPKWTMGPGNNASRVM